MRDQVDADRVVLAELPGRASTLVPTPSVEVASSGPLVAQERGGVEQPGETAGVVHDLGRGVPRHLRLHQLDGALARRRCRRRQRHSWSRPPASTIGRACHVTSCRARRACCVLGAHDGLGGGSAASVSRQRPVGSPRSWSPGAYLPTVVVGRSDRVHAVEAGAAEPSAGIVVASVRPSSEMYAERVGAERGADLLDGERAGDQLGPGGEVDAVEARPGDGRRGDPDVDLARRPPRAASGPSPAGCCRARSSRRRRPGACPR